MASLPRSRCNAPRCRGESVKGSIFCSVHAPPLRDAPSKADLAAYKTNAWNSIRQRVLSTQPLCQCCLLAGRTVAAEAVDHVWPWRSIGKQAFLRNRFQSLCSGCHSRKSALEARGICREFRVGGAVDHTLNDWHRMVQ